MSSHPAFGLEPILTDRARFELGRSEVTPWAVDEAVFAVHRTLHNKGLSSDIVVDAVQDPESPPPPTIGITVFVKDVTSKDRFELWDSLAQEVEEALSRWKPEHRIVVIVKKDGGA